jgi:hypothetical protein
MIQIGEIFLDDARLLLAHTNKDAEGKCTGARFVFEGNVEVFLTDAESGKALADYLRLLASSSTGAMPKM